MNITVGEINASQIGTTVMKVSKGQDIPGYMAEHDCKKATFNINAIITHLGDKYIVRPIKKHLRGNQKIINLTGGTYFDASKMDLVIPIKENKCLNKCRSFTRLIQGKMVKK